jgi:hypothetical protein
MALSSRFIMTRTLRNALPFFALVLGFSACGGEASDGVDVSLPEASSSVPEGVWSVPEGASASDDIQDQYTTFSSELKPSDETSVSGPSYYTLRPDLRRCAPTHCGGFFLKRVNGLTTACADGSRTPECYAADLDLSALGLAPEQSLAIASDPESYLLAGDLVPATNGAGRLLVTEAWAEHTVTDNGGAFLRVKNSGVVCITSPCPSHSVELLNSLRHAVSIGNVNLTDAADPSDALEQLNTSEGLIVAGSPAIVTGPDGRALGFYASHYYIPVLAPTRN